MLPVPRRDEPGFLTEVGARVLADSRRFDEFCSRQSDISYPVLRNWTSTLNRSASLCPVQEFPASCLQKSLGITLIQTASEKTID